MSDVAAMREIGIETDYLSARTFFEACDWDYNTIYYLAEATEGFKDDIVLKMILSTVLETLNTRGMSLTQINELISPLVLNTIVHTITTNAIDKLFVKDVLAEAYDHNFVDDVRGERWIRDIIDSGRYKTTDDDDVKQIVEHLIKDNQQLFIDSRTIPNKAQWFVGQTMKATKGKANPSLVLHILDNYDKSRKDTLEAAQNEAM